MDNIDKIIKLDMQNQLKEAFKTYGIEKTEEIIIEVYKHLPKLMMLYLIEYKNVITKGE